MGLLARYTDTIDLPGGWQWLSNGWVIGILAVLLAVEMVADKIPVVDHVNDVIQTVVRPTAGGLAFGATSGAQTMMVRNPGQFFHGHQWVPVVTGVVISLFVHTTKAASRPVINTATVGVGAPIVSTLEDFSSTTLSVVAILFPVLVVVLLIGIVLTAWALMRRIGRRRAARRSARLAATG